MASALKRNIILSKGDIILGEKIRRHTSTKGKNIYQFSIRTELEIVVIRSKCLLDEKTKTGIKHLVLSIDIDLWATLITWFPL